MHISKINSRISNSLTSSNLLSTLSSILSSIPQTLISSMLKPKKQTITNHHHFMVNMRLSRRWNYLMIALIAAIMIDNTIATLINNMNRTTLIKQHQQQPRSQQQHINNNNDYIYNNYDILRFLAPNINSRLAMIMQLNSQLSNDANQARWLMQQKNNNIRNKRRLVINQRSMNRLVNFDPASYNKYPIHNPYARPTYPEHMSMRLAAERAMQDDQMIDNRIEQLQQSHSYQASPLVKTNQYNKIRYSSQSEPTDYSETERTIIGNTAAAAAAAAATVGTAPVTNPITNKSQMIWRQKWSNLLNKNTNDSKKLLESQNFGSNNRANYYKTSNNHHHSNNSIFAGASASATVPATAAAHHNWSQTRSENEKKKLSKASRKTLTKIDKSNPSLFSGSVLNSQDNVGKSFIVSSTFRPPNDAVYGHPVMREPREAGSKKLYYDVLQIDCPDSESGMDRFACPSSDSNDRYLCIDDQHICNGYVDCPRGEDEDPMACMFYKSTKAHLDVLADYLLQWARGRQT